MHTFESTENSMQILNYQEKGPHLNTIERFYIHTQASSENQFNDKWTLFPTKIFDSILKIWNIISYDEPHPK